jgi:hypothetical protein
MKNRERLIKHTDLYDLLTRIQSGLSSCYCKDCIITLIEGNNSHNRNRCTEYFDKGCTPNCNQCIADWLNEEEV